MDAVACEFYLGTALVPLRNLSYLESETHGDSCTGCCVNDVYHNLPTLIRALDLQALLDGSGTDSRSLYHVVDYPKLACPESMQLSCLHGEFRLRTARANANAPSEWWTVDLYTVGMSSSSLLSVISLPTKQKCLLALVTIFGNSTESIIPCVTARYISGCDIISGETLLRTVQPGFLNSASPNRRT